MSLTVRFDFTACPLPANQAVAEAATLVRLAQASPLGCRVEVVNAGISEGVGELLAAQIGPVFKVIR